MKTDRFVPPEWCYFVFAVALALWIVVDVAMILTPFGWLVLMCLVALASLERFAEFIYRSDQP